METTPTDNDVPRRLEDIPVSATRLAWRCIRVLGATYKEAAKYSRADVPAIQRRVTRLDLYLTRRGLDPQTFAANEVANLGPEMVRELLHLVRGEDT